MHLVTVHPLHTVFPAHKSSSLSYYTKEKMLRGALIEIPIRNKVRKAIVAECSEVKDKKMLLKTSGFRIKKTGPVICPSPFFIESFLTDCEIISEYFLTQTGLIFKHFMPSYIINNCSKLKSFEDEEKRTAKNTKNIIFEGDINERITFYKKEISKLSQDENVMIVSPSLLYAKYIADILKNNNNVILFHLKLTNKKILDHWAKIRSGKGIIAVGTPSVLSAIGMRTGLIIIDDATSGHYKYPHLPRISIRKSIEIIADTNYINLITGVNSLASNEIYMLEKKIAMYEKIAKPKSSKKALLIDMEKEESKKKDFPVISEQIRNMIQKKNCKIVLFVSRRGYNTFSICRDCGKTIICSSCSAPFTLHNANPSRKLICHHCGLIRTGDFMCANCESWNIVSYGIGSQLIEKKIKDISSSIPIYRMDSDSVKNDEERSMIMKNFLLSEAGVLIGTEMLFEEPALRADVSAIINIDNMLTYPDFSISEKISRIIETLKQKSDLFILQTFFPDNPLYTKSINNMHADYFASELSERRSANLPPYSLIVALTLKAKYKDQLIKRASETEAELKNIGGNIESGNAFIEKEKGYYFWRIIIRTDSHKWLNSAYLLRNKLRNLSSEWSIVIDPISVL